MINHLTELVNVADKDEMISGNCYVEFGERSIRVIKPEDISISTNKSPEKVYGKSLLESLKK